MIKGEIQPPRIAMQNDRILRRHIYSVALAWFFRRHVSVFGDVGTFFFPDAGGTGTELLREELSGRPKELLDALGRIVPDEMQESLELNTWGWVEQLLGKSKERPGVLQVADDGVRVTVNRLDEEQRERSKAEKSTDYFLRVKATIKRRDIISFFANHNVLPKYGFPVDVVELELLHHGDAAKRLELQRDLRIALSEYAPGSHIVAGGAMWASRGLKRLPQREWPKFKYVLCADCGRYYSCRHDTEELPELCSICGAKLPKRGNFIEPIFGFVTGADEPTGPSESRPPRTFTSRVFFVNEGEASEPERILETSVGFVRGVCSRRGRLAVLNRSGFWVCSWCGHAVSGNDASLGPHHKPWSNGDACGGKPSYWDLGHEFYTDVLRLEFPSEDRKEDSFWRSLLYAVLEGIAEALDIRRDDLDGVLCPKGAAGVAPALIVYDDVPGGAGHVRRVFDQIEAVLESARRRVDGGCGCGGGPEGLGDTSCYGCLRNYPNQWCHEDLQRGPVLRYLDRLLQKSPTALSVGGFQSGDGAPSASREPSTAPIPRYQLDDLEQFETLGNEQSMRGLIDVVLPPGCLERVLPSGSSACFRILTGTEATDLAPIRRRVVIIRQRDVPHHTLPRPVMVGELVVREMVNADGQPSSRRITLRPKGSDLESAPFTLVLAVDQESEFRIFAVLEQGGKQDG